jgi:hypothetical protein
MKSQQFLVSGITLMVMLVLMAGLSQAQAPDPQQAAISQNPVDDAALALLSTSFTYQGYLTDGSNPANGAYDFQFTLYNASSGGSQVGSIVTKGNVNVAKGLFNVALSFGSVFDGTRLWLEIAVRPTGGTGYTILSPRQEILPSPYAFYTNRAGGLSASDGDPADAVTVDSNGSVKVQGVAPIRIIRYENKGDDADFSTSISANDYYCVAAGWSTSYDIDEDGGHYNMVWTYVSGTTWRVHVQFPDHEGNIENPDVDIVCFRKEIASWEGASVTLHNPD